MKIDLKVIEYLNKVLGQELIAINQYFLHARTLQHWGFLKLGDKTWKESIEEMQHADSLTQRILFLEGLPNLQDLGKLFIGQNVKEILECDLRLEKQAVPILREAIAYMESVSDYVSRNLLEDILKNEEEHMDYLETQLELYQKLGESNYLQLQV